MPKFVVREKSGEFYTCLTAESIEGAVQQMIEIVKKLRAMGENLEYTIEPEPQVEVFESENDWLNDWNNPASRHHY